MMYYRKFVNSYCLYIRIRRLFVGYSNYTDPYNFLEGEIAVNGNEGVFIESKIDFDDTIPIKECIKSSLAEVLLNNKLSISQVFVSYTPDIDFSCDLTEDKKEFYSMINTIATKDDITEEFAEEMYQLICREMIKF